MATIVNWENDSFANTFVGCGETHILKNYIFDNSTLYHLGQIEGKSLLDIGCAEGQFCRLVKSKGASRVLGVDVSPLLIEKAKEQDVEGKCEYQVDNIYKMGKIGEFDCVTANLLIPYAKTVEDLTTMCQAFYDNLTPGGRFVGIALNCLKSDYDWGKSLEKYGIESFSRISVIDKLTTVELILKPNSKFGSYFKTVGYYFEPKVYENAFLQSGFKSLCFKPFCVSKEALENFPHNFWDDYIENSHHICLVAEK